MSRDIRLESVRGAACLLLVMYHVIGDTPYSGLRIPEGDWLRIINDFFSYIRMPLFTFLSGYVYAFRPFTSGGKSFLKGKGRRLLIPMFIVGTGFAVIQSLTPGTNQALVGQDWLLLHIKPVAHYWYLEALFLIFVLLVPLEYFKLLSAPQTFIAVFLLAVTIQLSSIQVSSLFGLFGMVYLLPYFLAGLFVNRFLAKIEYGKWSILFASLLTVLLTWSALVFLEPSLRFDKTSLMAVAIGCLSSTLLLWWFPKISWLARLGKYSYSIYLFHVFGTAAARIILSRLGIESVYILLAVSLFIGIALPVYVERLAKQYSFSATMLLGRAYCRT